MAWATTDDGCEIYFETAGSGPDVVVFVSGYFGVTSIWDEMVVGLSPTHRCIAYDNRGYGRSSKPVEASAYNIERHARDLEAVLTAAGVTAQKVVLVAHSMGGSISTTFFLRNKQNVRGIVYAATNLDGKTLADKGTTSQMLKDGVASPSMAPAFYEAFGLPAELAMEAAKWPTFSLFANADALVAVVLEGRFTEVTVPTLVVSGDRDVTTPAEDHLRPLFEALPNSRLEILQDVNHFPQVEAPRELLALLCEFMVEVKRS